MTRTPTPLLVSVTACALLVEKTTWVENVRLAGESVTAGKTPTPVSGTDCGLPGALSLMVTVASRVPVVAGVKVALILQVLFGDREEGQLLVWAKSPLFVPPTWIDLNILTGRFLALIPTRLKQWPGFLVPHYSMML